MTIEYVSGDLFANHYNVQAFAHGCNCQGRMGAGIAIGFKERYPQMYDEYRKRCLAQPPQFNLGDVFFWREPNKPAVFNLGTQERPGHRAQYEAIESALLTLRTQADRQGTSTIAIPRIGAGYGGRSWQKIRALVENVFASWSGTLYVYEEYVPGK